MEFKELQKNLINLKKRNYNLKLINYSENDGIVDSIKLELLKDNNLIIKIDMDLLSIDLNEIKKIDNCLTSLLINTTILILNLLNEKETKAKILNLL